MKIIDHFVIIIIDNLFKRGLIHLAFECIMKIAAISTCESINIRKGIRILFPLSLRLVLHNSSFPPPAEAQFQFISYSEMETE